MLAEGMLSSLSASSGLTRRSSPCTVMMRSLSMALGSAACGVLDPGESIAVKSKVRNSRARLASVSSRPYLATSRGPSALAGERRDLVAHPVVAFVAIVARMPEETHRERERVRSAASRA